MVHEVDKDALVDAGHVLRAEVIWRKTDCLSISRNLSEELVSQEEAFVKPTLEYLPKMEFLQAKSFQNRPQNSLFCGPFNPPYSPPSSSPKYPIGRMQGLGQALGNTPSVPVGRPRSEIC
jgi:hypothetical protein